jgi:hypothetical protein
LLLCCVGTARRTRTEWKQDHVVLRNAEDGEEDPAVDLFAEASKPDTEDEDEADEAEPEDDFNAAWEVLDLAGAIYEKRMDGNDEMQLKAADTFIALGDISLETGAFSLLSSYLTCFLL